MTTPPRPPLSPLPIDDQIPFLLDALQHHNAVLVQATPGAGKTTRVPPALLDITPGEILVLEPRRLAARLSAARVAEERGEALGETIGFQIRHEKLTSDKTRVRFITEGLFLRMLLGNPTLKGIGAVVLDEFHERHIHTDVALALCRSLQTQGLRPDLKLIIMSATLNTADVQAFIPGIPTSISEGRAHPVTLRHLPYSPDKIQLEDKVAQGVFSLLQDPACPGDILVFLPGSAEIRKAAQRLSGQNAFELYELKADTPFAEQQKIFAPSLRRKVILSTNVAETSVTIPGVTGVVDSGLARMASHATWSGVQSLDMRPVSQASLTQRMGRAGRTASGVCLRLFTEVESRARPPFETPEIQRMDLTGIVLELKVAAFQRPELAFERLPWMDPPPEPLVQSACRTLEMLGALDAKGQLTQRGLEMSHWPLHPRLSRVALAAKDEGCFPQGLLAVALVSEGGLLRRGAAAFDHAESDITWQMEWFQRLSEGGWNQSRAQAFDRGAHGRVEAVFRQLLHQEKLRRSDAPLHPLSEVQAATLFLTGYGDRLAARRKTQNRQQVEYTLGAGGGAVLQASSAVHNAPFVIAIDSEETQAKSASESTQIRMATGLTADVLLLAAPAADLESRTEFEWDGESERVRGWQRTYCKNLILEEKQVGGQHPEGEKVLLEALRRAWPKPFEDSIPLEDFDRRKKILQDKGLGQDLPDLNHDDFELLLAQICEGKKSFQEILEEDLEDYMDALLSAEGRKQLMEYAPDRITIGKGRKVRVRYEEGKPPYVTSRLQDFFGLKESPRIARGQIPLVLHLCAPNGVAVSVTSDLMSFWKNHYPATRKELCRKYPKHSWPEDPITAEPPEVKVRRKWEAKT